MLDIGHWEFSILHSFFQRHICNCSNDLCFGCRRTGKEIGNWSKYNNEKEAIIEKPISD